MANWHWFPYLEGKLLTYAQYFTLVSSLVCIILAGLCLLLRLVLKRVFHKGGQHYQEVVVEATVKRASVVEKVEWFLLGSAFFWISFIPVLCQAFDLIPWALGLLLNFGVLSAGLVVANYVDYSEETRHHYKSSYVVEFKKSLGFKKRSMKKKWLYVALGSLLLNGIFYRTCLCFFNDEIKYYNQLLGFGLSTFITRLVTLPVACPYGGPCQLYTTLPEDSVTSVFVNLHTHTSVHNVTVYYAPIDSLNSSDFKVATAVTYNFKGLDTRDARNVHSALIRNLAPSTKYLIKIFYDNQFWAVSTYKTFSNDPSVPIRVMNAGDSGYTIPAINLTRVAATLKPDVFFIGGDIAYDDNLAACVFTWDYYLGLYGSLTTSLGYMMPIVLTVGNHDVGLNELPGINITIDEYGPAFFLFFPQHYDTDAKMEFVYQVPPLNRRRSVFYHEFSNMVYISLDSGYLHGFGGWQEQELIRMLQMAPKKTKFVNYHVPIYSGCEDFDQDDKRYLYALFHWIPHFDQYKVMTAYENHVHSFKRTKPLIGNIYRENGTVYVGDGSFGALLKDGCTPDRTVDLFAKQGNINHFWMSIVNDYQVTHTAHDTRGRVVDNFTQLVSTYTF